jgi:hypothetical protein
VTGTELKARLDRLVITRRKAAEALGLTERGLYHQLSGERAVTRQTQLLLDVLEQKLRDQRRVA